MRKNRLTDIEQQQKDRKNMTMPKPIYQNTQPIQSYKFFIGPGNNSSLVRKILSTRKNWQEIDDSKHIFLNFKWQQTYRGYKYDNSVQNKILRQSFNHFEFHHQISNKENLLRNMIEYCQHNKINAFDYLPVTYNLCINDVTFDHSLHAFLKFFQHNMPQGLKKKNRKHWMSFKRRSHNIQTSSIEKKVNYFYCKPELREVYKAQQSQYLWILKPTSFNRGFGIHLFNQIQKLQEWMNKYINGFDPKGGIIQKISEMEKTVSQDVATSLSKNQKNIEDKQQQEKPKVVSSPQIKKKQFRIREPSTQSKYTLRTSSFIVQKYLEKPLLISGRKFDIRIWVLYTQDLKVYWFPQGYLRTSSYTYSTNENSINNSDIHLTNNAVQKNNKDYGKYQDGNQLSFRHLQNTVINAGGNYQKLINKIKKIIKITALSIRKKINKRDRQLCFQIFGYDFMVDSKCKPWLIQVNTNPCLQQSSLLLAGLIPRMLDDAFSLTIDKIFPSNKNNYLYPNKNESNEDNLWELIIDLKKQK